MHRGVRGRLVRLRSHVHCGKGDLHIVDDTAVQAVRLLQLRRERVVGSQRAGEHRGCLSVEVAEVQGVQRDQFRRSGEDLRLEISTFVCKA